ncbi:hypothetical protein M758_10G000600 [Ceratodon purpureus]|nr:hypothetical protein M758_10G000600 [Ceratodon purpureus]
MASSVVAGALKAFVGVLLWGLFFFWVVEWFIYPTERYVSWKADAIAKTSTNFLELNGPFFLMWSFPVFLFAIFALLYLELDQHYTKREKNAKLVPKWKRVWRRISGGMWSQPILVRSPLGVLTGMDLLVISFVLFGTLWILFQPLIPMLEIVDHSTMKPGIERWMIKVGRVGTWTGRAWYLPMALLFIPVSRNSPFLRLVNIPFEHAVKFHRWLGHFSLVILVLHSITFALHIYYTGGGSMKGVWEWKVYGVSNLAGVISMVAGLVLWVTSLGPVRQHFFDVFYITHHLYIVVFAFAVWHVGDFSSFFFLAGVLLFFIDRFIRMIQSQAPVSILSSRVLPSGVVELKFPKSSKLKHSALGFIFINVPGISKFQWHPFSTTSSSLQGDDNITICVKPLGEWTRSLQKLIIAADTANSNSKGAGAGCPLQLFVEGPYGPEKDYFLQYKTLVLVAGGVGITPFLAVLRDLLCRYNQELGSHPEGLPTDVHLIWCVPREADLATLRDLQPARLLPNYAGGPLKIDVKVFVTREQPGARTSSEKLAFPGSQGEVQYEVLNNGVNADEKVMRRKVVGDVRGSNLWFAAVIAAATAGFLIFHGIFHNYVVRPNHHTDAPFYFEHGSAHTAAHGPQGKPFPTWATVSLLFVSMFLGVVVCGGTVLFAWANLDKRDGTDKSSSANNGPGDQRGQDKVSGGADMEMNEASLLKQATIIQGSRPDLRELLYDVGAGSVGNDVGVLVSGPTSMQESVASACRAFNFRNVCGGTQLQYHSISFDF